MEPEKSYHLSVLAQKPDLTVTHFLLCLSG